MGNLLRRAVSRPRSLRAQLLLSILVVLVGTLLAGSALVSIHAANKVAIEMRAAISVGVRIAHNAVDDVEERSDPERRLRLLVADFDGDRHLRAVYLDMRGNEIASSRIEPPERTVPDWFFRLFGGQSVAVRVELPRSFDNLGSLELRTDARNEVSELWAELCLMLGLLAAFCAGTLGIVLTLVNRAFRPLGALSDAFQRIGSGSPVAPLVEAGPEELVRIYGGFNGMRERLGRAERRNSDLAEQLQTVQEEERADIARDLHDEIGPFLFSVDVDATAIETSLGSDADPLIAQRLTMIHDSVRHMRKHVKDILARLRPAALVDVGLVSAIDGLVAFWRLREPEMTINVRVPQDGFGSDIDDVLFRVIQESISNAVRHGRPSRIDITADVDEQEGIRLEIVDDGVGLIAGRGNGDTSGFGISGMRERLQYLGGTLLIVGQADAPGTAVRARVPFAHEIPRRVVGQEAARA